jgi:glycosyltransferase involved in cell wall biosynthesis
VDITFSIIVPVYNRPKEVDELLNSFDKVENPTDYEIIIIEDGSLDTCKHVVDQYQKLPISYVYQNNAGPGMARNHGAQHAKYNYLIFLDSDVILPQKYLVNVYQYLIANHLDCFGGPDQDHAEFSNIQKAVDYAMTSFFTTGGIRGNTKSTKKYEPRSFNLGIKKELFLKIKGFKHIHPGEDPEMIIRLKKETNAKIGFIPDAKVIHKRRISLKKFSLQLYKFGLVRPIITQWHPNYDHITFYFPLLFSLGLIGSLLFTLFKIYDFIYIYILYSAIIFTDALIIKKSLNVAAMSFITTYVQFISYSYGFAISFINFRLLNKKPEKTIPKLFFNK